MPQFDSLIQSQMIKEIYWMTLEIEEDIWENQTLWIIRKTYPNPKPPPKIKL